MVEQLSGVASTFSYTTAAGVNLAITGRCGYGQQLTLNGTLGVAPHVYGFLGASTDTNEDSYSIKSILTENQTISGSGANINSYGIAFYGIEL